MTTLTILTTGLFAIVLIGFIFGLILLILPTLKKVVINLSVLILILAVIFFNLVRDITKAIKYVTIG